MLWPNGTRVRPTISSGFGPRAPIKAPNGQITSSFHRGCDFIGFSAVRSVDAGVVEKVGVVRYWEAAGQQVWVRNADGSLARYFHLATGSIRVRVGQRVAMGEQLATMGSTGASTGTHLHLEIVPKGATAQVDPVPYIQARLTPAGSSAGNGSTPITSEEEDMTYILEIKGDSQAAKSVYNIQTGRAVRLLGKDENTALRAARAAGSTGIVYIGVSRAEYKARGGF